MKEVLSDRAVTAQAGSFNYNKLQAVLCIASSAAVSIGVIYWAIQALF